MPIQEYTEPNVCIGENLTTDDAGQLRVQPWTVPRPVADVRAMASGDGAIGSTQSLPGVRRLVMRMSWRNDAPLPQGLKILITRGSRSIITSNPNAIQFRDRWTWAIDAPASRPITTSISNGRMGAALDVQTNSVSEPNPGKLWTWDDGNSVEEWIPRELEPDEQLNVWYQCYVWTPPPWSDNANKNAPQHDARANWVRGMLWAYPVQGTVVTG